MVDRVYERNASDSAPQPPADPSSGYPTGGNPAQGVPATNPGPYWYHMMTESLRRVVVEAGLTPDHEDLGQVVGALNRLATRGVTTVMAADSPRALTIADAGLILVDASGGSVELTLPSVSSNQGVAYRIVRTDTEAGNAVTLTPNGDDTVDSEASLSIAVEGRAEIEAGAAIAGVGDWEALVIRDASETNRGILRIATTAKAQGLTDNETALTPATLDSALKGGNQGLSENGYQKLPGGLIIQWGVTSLGIDQSKLVTMPITFPSAILAGFITGPIGIDGSGYRFAGGNANAADSTTSQIRLNNDGPTAGNVNWLAIGF